MYKPDQTYKYLLVHKETTAHEVVMLALQEFSITDHPSSKFSLCEVSVTDTQTIKQRRLPDQLQNLAERIGLSSRYYLKTNGVTETLVPDELAPELVRESAVHFLQLNAVEVAIQLTLQVSPTIFSYKLQEDTPPNRCSEVMLVHHSSIAFPCHLIGSHFSLLFLHCLLFLISIFHSKFPMLLIYCIT